MERIFPTDLFWELEGLGDTPRPINQDVSSAGLPGWGGRHGSRRSRGQSSFKVVSDARVVRQQRRTPRPQVTLQSQDMRGDTVGTSTRPPSGRTNGGERNGGSVFKKDSLCDHLKQSRFAQVKTGRENVARTAKHTAGRRKEPRSGRRRLASLGRGDKRTLGLPAETKLDFGLKSDPPGRSH